jgi:hypothetical protein
VLVPMEVALEDAESHDRTVHSGERLVEPRLVSRDLSWDVDQGEAAVLVVEVDVVILSARRGCLQAARWMGMPRLGHRDSSLGRSVRPSAR